MPMPFAQKVGQDWDNFLVGVFKSSSPQPSPLMFMLQAHKSSGLQGFPFQVAHPPTFAAGKRLGQEILMDDD